MVSISDVFVGAALDFVVNTFFVSVLTGKSPGVTGRILMSITIRNESYICHVGETFGVECLVNASKDDILAIRTEGLNVDLDLDFIGDSQSC